MSAFQPGEIVDVQIKGGIVDHSGDPGHLRVSLPDRWSDIILEFPLRPGVTVERVAPANWPPQPGDVWREGDGTEYFAYRRRDGIVLVNAFGDEIDADYIRDASPHLVYRHTAAALTPRAPRPGGAR